MNCKLVLLVLAGLGISGSSGLAQQEPVPQPIPPALTNTTARPVPDSVPAPVPAQVAAPVAPVAEVESFEETVTQPVASSAPEAATSESQSEPSDPAKEKGPLSLDHELPAAIQFLARSANINLHIDPSVTFTNVAPPGPDGRPTITSYPSDGTT